MIVLDTDHLNVLRIGKGAMDTTVITFEEHMRGWLASIRRARVVSDEIRPYRQLVNLIRFFMTEPIAYLKGRVVPASQCTLPIYDLGIVLGAAVTDFLRTFHQRPYRMEDHVRRFYRSRKYARIEPPVGLDESMEAANYESAFVK